MKGNPLYILLWLFLILCFAPQGELAAMVGVSRQTISYIETGQFNPTAKLALLLCIALDKKFEELFYFG